MNRREFFGRFASVPIAASFAIPELTRTIFLPPRGGWYGNTFVTPTYIVNEALKLLEADLIYGYGRVYVLETGKTYQWVNQQIAVLKA